jgi:hypothetical protein
MAIPIIKIDDIPDNWGFIPTRTTKNAAIAMQMAMIQMIRDISLFFKFKVRSPFNDP